MNKKKFSSLLLVMMVILSCQKHKNEWWIKGDIIDTLTGNPMSGIEIKAEVKKLQSGVYNDIITTAASDQSAGDGSFELIWARENISYCRLVASKDNYFDAIIEVSPDDMKPGEAYVQNVQMVPRSDLQIYLSSTDPSALVKLSVFSADPYCTCNDNGEYSITGTVDTLIHCMAGGGQWLKYQIQAFGSNGNVNHLDSIYCEPFITNNIQYVY